ncbi:hypothetical protein LSUE1_G004619 [Lachnellula suecica]|uniref:FAD dependent oxidoreductase domain-containing protein n=1 Tax=Lachnellula suecica TaxID=602035 RepID=A0A8T9C417_9HELO|nr:hypothetical protein LSUE1_G004619 [Lachnellula suecica]
MASSAKHAHSRFPNATSTTPHWRTQIHDLDEFRSSETVPSIVDVAIIGGGLAGASTAYHLLAGVGTENPTKAAPSIAIFEARQACSGATGRNGGHTKQAPLAVAKFASKHGPRAGLDFALFLGELMRKMRACAESIFITDSLDDEKGSGSSSSKTVAHECEMLRTRSWDVIIDEQQAADVEKEWSQTVAAMKAAAKEDGRERDLQWLGDVQFLKGEIVEQVTSIRGAKAALSCPAISLWPYKFVMGLLQHVIRLGVELYTLTPVTKIERVSEEEAGQNISASSTNGFTALHTPRGITLARKVVFASNAYAANLLPQFQNTIVPVRGTACRIVRSTSTSSSATAPAPNYARLINTYNIYGSPTSREYLVPRPDGSIILGGGQPLYRDDKSVWYDMVDDGSLIEGVRERWFEGYMGKYFHGWDPEGKDEKIDRIWTGIMGVTEDSLPHVGLVPGESDHFILAGFNGGGMSNIFLIARGIARMVRDEISYEETGLLGLFKSVPERIQENSLGANARLFN